MKYNASGSAPITFARLSTLHPHGLAVTFVCIPVPLVQASKETEVSPGKQHLC